MKERFDKFINEVFCRKPSNQRRAHILWYRIRLQIPQEVRNNFTVEWGHYLSGELDHDGFGEEIDKLKQYFKKSN